MADLKASDYRQKFLEEIGFPLIKANAKRFVQEVGDLRKTDNLKIVFEAAMRWKEQQPKDMSEELARQQSQLSELTQKLDVAQAEIEELKSRQVELSPEEPTKEPERQLAEYIASVSLPTAEDVLSAVFYADKGAAKDTYRRLSKVFHPDTTRLPKDEAATLFALVRRLYEQINSRPLANNIVNDERKESESETGTTSYWVNDIGDIDF
jgi:hypothetical protein